MSNLWINWRFGLRHLKIGPDKPYISFNKNHFLDPKEDRPWFENCG